MTNLDALLNTIKFSEIGAKLITLSDQGYNICVGSTPSKPILFPELLDGSVDYSKHPNIYNETCNSTAAGGWQLLFKYWVAYCQKLSLSGFTPDVQRAIATQQVRERNALALILAGNFDGAILRCNTIWASLPGSPYGQHTNNMNDLRAYYIAQGGIVSQG